MSRPEPGGTGSGSGPALVDGVDVEAVATAVRGCAAVEDLYSNPARSVASYLPGRQVPGVRVSGDTVTVQVRSRWAIPVGDVAEQVRGASAHLVGERRIDVVIADIADPPPTAPAALTAGTTDAPDTPTASGISEVLWTPISTVAGPPAGNSSAPITLTGAETPPIS